MKYKWIGVCLILLALMFLFRFLAGNRTTMVTNEKIPFDIIQKGTYSGLNNQKNYSVVNASQWELVWDMITDKITPQPKRPSINFKDSMIVVVAQGEKNTGGYTIDVQNIYARNGIVYVVIEEKSPGKECTTTQALTQPYEIIKLKKVDNPIQFLRQNTVSACS